MDKYLISFMNTSEKGGEQMTKPHDCDGWTCDFCDKKTCMLCGGVMDFEGTCACRKCKVKEGIKGITEKQIKEGGF